ncbi:MAG: RpiB/LacA/LacB family sugar-phosphate isomerase, partial [Candidatus Magasanikbacteria bacterium]|nr:RpiB/LacA/LacB family sugar-phosphate isomerase [Candidatus Magasanikbacteria bacterium]
FAHIVGQMVSQGEVDFGVLVCGTGKGMAITANKWIGVRAVTVKDLFEAEMVRAHNDANVMCLGDKLIDQYAIYEVLNKFFTTPFEGGRHARRVGKIENIT